MINNVQERIAKINSARDQANSDIKEAEEILQKIGAPREIQFAYVKWSPLKRRICSASFGTLDRPLIECPTHERISGAMDLNGLIDRALMSIELTLDDCQEGA